MDYARPGGGSSQRYPAGVGKGIEETHRPISSMYVLLHPLPMWAVLGKKAQMTKIRQAHLQGEIAVRYDPGRRQCVPKGPGPSPRTTAVITGRSRLPNRRGRGGAPQCLWCGPDKTIRPDLFQFGAVARIQQLIARRSHASRCLSSIVL